MSLTRSGSFRRSLHSDSVPKRRGISTSPVPSVIATLDNVHEDSEGEGLAARLLARESHSMRGSVFDSMNSNRWNHFPRLSTTYDLPILDFSKDQSIFKIDSLKFSIEELLETYSNGHSTDEESIININTTTKTNPAPESAGRKASGLRRAMSNSSTKIKSVSSRLRRVPSNLIARSMSREQTLGSQPQTKSLPASPTQQEDQIQEQLKLRRSIRRAMSRSFLRAKENDRPGAA